MGTGVYAFLGGFTNAYRWEGDDDAYHSVTWDKASEKTLAPFPFITPSASDNLEVAIDFISKFRMVDVHFLPFISRDSWRKPLVHL